MLPWLLDILHTLTCPNADWRLVYSYEGNKLRMKCMRCLHITRGI
jgi:hypothetical protein